MPLKWTFQKKSSFEKTKCATFVQPHEKYLYKRNNIYYFCKKINNKVVKISLKSNNLEYCKILRDKILDRLNMKKEEKIINSVVEKEVSAKKVIKAELNPNMEFDAETLEKIMELGIRALGKNNIYESLLTQRQLSEQTIYKISDKNDLEEISKKLDNIAEFQTTLTHLSTNQNNELIEKSPMILANLDTYYQDFLEHNKTYDPKSISSFKNFNAALKYLKYFSNETTILNFSFFKDIQAKLQLIPKYFANSKKFYIYSFEEIVELNEIEDMDTLKNNTITNHMSFYKCFFQYLIYREILKENPLDNIIPLPAVESNKIQYSQDDLEKIFSSNIEQEYKDMCKVSLYTGLRIRELLSIKKEDIKDGFINITLEDTSKKKHQRLIPVHKNIEKIIKHQTKHNQSAYLFFDFDQKNEVTNVGKRLNRRLHDIIPNLIIGDEEMRKSFHCLRKNFSQEIEMNTQAEEKTKKYLMGHSFENDVTHKVYNLGKVNIQKLVDCINQITFEY